MKKNLCVLFCLMILISILAISCSSAKGSNGENVASVNRTSSKIDYNKYGKEIKEYFQTNPDEEEDLYFKGRDTVITKKEINKIVLGYQMLKQMEEQEAYSQAENFLMRREATYFEAVQKGFSVTDGEVDQTIASQKDGIENAENKAELDDFLSGLDMTIDRYMESQREQITKELTIAKYWDSEKEAYLASLHHLDLKEQEEKWETEKENRYKDLIAAQNYTKIKD